MAQTLQRRSLLPNYHTVSQHIRICSFIHGFLCTYFHETRNFRSELYATACTEFRRYQSSAMQRTVESCLLPQVKHDLWLTRPSVTRTSCLPSVSLLYTLHNNTTHSSHTTKSHTVLSAYRLFTDPTQNYERHYYTKQTTNKFSLFHRAFWFIKFYSHQLMHFFIQLCISLLSYIKIT